MKRLWLGIGILAALLGLGIATTVGLSRVCGPVSEQLQTAADAAENQDWDRAEQLFRQARSRWEKYRNLNAAVTNHEPMEEIDAMFGALEIYARYQDAFQFADSCARLAALTAAIGEAQAVWWWNLL